MKKLLSKISDLFQRASAAEKVLRQMTPEARTAAVETFGDVLAFVAAADAAGAEKGLNFTLDASVIALAQKLYQDAKSDITEAKALFDALGIAVKAPVAPAPVQKAA